MNILTSKLPLGRNRKRLLTNGSIAAVLIPRKACFPLQNALENIASKGPRPVWTVKRNCRDGQREMTSSLLLSVIDKSVRRTQKTGTTFKERSGRNPSYKNRKSQHSHVQIVTASAVLSSVTSSPAQRNFRAAMQSSQHDQLIPRRKRLNGAIKASLTMRENCCMGMYGLLVAGNRTGTTASHVQGHYMTWKGPNFSFIPPTWVCVVCGAEGGLVHLWLYWLNLEAALAGDQRHSTLG